MSPFVLLDLVISLHVLVKSLHAVGFLYSIVLFDVIIFQDVYGFVFV